MCLGNPQICCRTTWRLPLRPRGELARWVAVRFRNAFLFACWVLFVFDRAARVSSRRWRLWVLWGSFAGYSQRVLPDQACRAQRPGSISLSFARSLARPAIASIPVIEWIMAMLDGLWVTMAMALLNFVFTWRVCCESGVSNCRELYGLECLHSYRLIITKEKEVVNFSSCTLVRNFFFCSVYFLSCCVVRWEPPNYRGKNMNISCEWREVM